ncbi:hypothetical protein [Psychrosphaera haliotis]|uniref:hypothetical protein n=1 Tax=Psychrosphaera haliotis TaxID=555083 RepID=UPI001E5DBEA1|nr:hypothetical protein [Psychrosphaera haliotis]
MAGCANNQPNVSANIDLVQKSELVSSVVTAGDQDTLQTIKLNSVVELAIGEVELKSMYRSALGHKCFIFRKLDDDTNPVFCKSESESWFKVNRITNATGFNKGL